MQVDGKITMQLCYHVYVYACACIHVYDHFKHILYRKKHLHHVSLSGEIAFVGKRRSDTMEDTKAALPAGI